MDTKKFTLLVSALTAVICMLTVVYNFASMPAYGDEEVSAAALYPADIYQGVSVQQTSSSPLSNTVSDKASGISSETQDGGSQQGSSGDAQGSDADSAAPSAMKNTTTGKTKTKAAATAQNPVNLNSANLAELESVPYIGPTKAQHILDYRSAHGAFKSIDELDNVSGFGAKTIAKVRPYLKLK